MLRDTMPLDDVRTSDLDRAEAEFSIASAALRRSTTDLDAAVSLAGIWKQGAQRTRRWGAVHLRAGREIGRWYERIKPGRGRPPSEGKVLGSLRSGKMGGSPIFPTAEEVAAKLGVGRRDITRFITLAHIPADEFDAYLLETDAPSYEGCIAYGGGEPSASRSTDPVYPGKANGSASLAAPHVAVLQCPNGGTYTNTERFTPPEFFSAMGVQYDVDVASPGADRVPWIPASRHITKRENGLKQPWGEDAFAWMNCPFGLRHGVMEWIERFIQHGNGVAIFADFTSTGWFQRMLAACDAALFVSPKIQFLPRERNRRNALGSTAFAIGERGVQALHNAQRNGRGEMLVKQR